MLRIVLADDHLIVRQGMLSLLEAEPGWDVIGDVSDGLGAVELISELQPDVAIVDVMMPDLNGLDVVERVARTSPNTKVVVRSMYSDQSYVVRALRAGAMAYVLKASSTSNLVTAIHEVTAGRHYLSPR
jgi:two-component system, NarL family, response regulator NreC